jgi:hypothetical protein
MLGGLIMFQGLETGGRLESVCQDAVNTGQGWHFYKHCVLDDIHILPLSANRRKP